MTIPTKVARAIDDARFSSSFDAQATAAINAFLAAAAEEGWHMRPDEATEEMVKVSGSYCPETYRAMLAASPKFEWNK